jgi:hypothetical protein
MSLKEFVAKRKFENEPVDKMARVLDRIKAPTKLTLTTPDKAPVTPDEKKPTVVYRKKYLKPTL